ncbi:hypothetical protein LAZ67_X004164 [Cordylochernes scorpioides]|uniref:Uncharacterized protein n=1 Tax=Cordylochernes scorpioides TaxID=51811 RepID=A0ABY6LZJ7_9ARAC|nr:hypothetical protein LAZ67_X004164 [Cordylochernes scorpioides]
MKVKHWENVENIQHHVITFLRSIPVEEFQGAFQAWQTRLRKCIDAGGIADSRVDAGEGQTNPRLSHSDSGALPLKAEEDEVHLQRRVGLLSGVALIVGTMIGESYGVIHSVIYEETNDEVY